MVIKKGKKIRPGILCKPQAKKKSKKIPYHHYIQGAVDQADQWNWNWYSENKEEPFRFVVQEDKIIKTHQTLAGTVKLFSLYS